MVIWERHRYGLIVYILLARKEVEAAVIAWAEKQRAMVVPMCLGQTRHRAERDFEVPVGSLLGLSVAPLGRSDPTLVVRGFLVVLVRDWRG